MAQLTFRVGADTLAATTAMDRLTAKVQEMTVKVGDSGDKFTQLDRNAEQLARRLGVELSGSTNKQIEAFKSLHDYLVKVGAPAKDVEASFKALQAAQEKYAEKAGPSFWDQHKTSILAAGTAITGFGVMAIKAFEESQLAGAKLQAVLKATGQVAGVTAEAAEKLADELSKMTGIDDEAILGAETILLHFTKIGKDVFPRATEAVLDLSKSLGKDLPTAALMVGKALESPAQGFEALQKATGKFTEAEVETIKAMVAQGKVADAQAEVLKKLEGQFGGTAKAIGETFTGSMDKGTVAAENFMETIGAELVPILQDLMKTFPDLSTVVIGTWNAFGSLNISAGDLAITAAALGPKLASVGAFLGKAGLVGGVAVASVALGQFIGTLEVGGKTIDQWVQKLYSMTLFHGKTTAALGDTEKAAKQLNILLSTPVYRNAGEDVESWYKRVLEAVKAHKELVPQVAYANTAVEKATNINKYHRISVQEQIEALKKEAQQIIATNGSNEKYNEVLSKIESLEKQSLATKDKVIQKLNQLAKIAMKDAAEAAAALVKKFDNLSDSMIRLYTAEQNALNAETFRPLLVDIPEGVNKLKGYIQDAEESWKHFGITSTAELDQLAEQANIDFEIIAKDATKTARDIELAMVKMMDANEARARAHGDVIPEVWDKMGKEITDKWEGTAKEVEDVWSKQVSTIVTDFSKGIADIIFEGKSFADTMIGIFKQFGQTILRTLLESLFNPLKGLFKELGDWLGDILKGAVNSIGKVLTGGSGILSAIGGWLGIGAGILAGPLINRLTRRGREKVEATGAAEEYGANIWQGIIPDMKSQAIGFAEGVQGLQKAWDDYVAYLKNNLKDQTVIQRSIDSQRIGLTQSMAAAAQIGIDQIRGAFDQIGETGQVTNEIIANLQDIAKGMQLAGTEAQKATSQFALFAAQFLQTGKMTDDFSAAITKAGGSVEFFTEAASKIQQLQGLRNEFAELKKLIDSIVPAQKSWQEAFFETGEITDELIQKINAAGASIEDFQKFSDMRKVKTEFESLIASFNETGTLSEKLMYYLKQYADPALYASLIQALDTSSKKAKETIDSVFAGTSLGIQKVVDAFTLLQNSWEATKTVSDDAIETIRKFADPITLAAFEAVIAESKKTGKSLGEMAATSSETASIINKAYSATIQNIKNLQTNFGILREEFNRTGIVSAQLAQILKDYADPEILGAFDRLMDQAKASGISIFDLANQSTDAADIIKKVFGSAAGNIDDLFTDSATKLSKTLAKMDENLGKSIQALQDALVTMIKDLIDVILEIPGAAEKAQQDFNKFMGLLETPEIDPITVSFVLNRERWGEDVAWAATQAQQAFAAGNRVWGTGAGFPSQDVASPTNPTRGAPTPRMAEGGLVFKPTLAIVGERGPEAIVPLNKAANLGNVYITVEKVETSDPEKFIDMLVGMAQTNRAGTKKRLKTVLA